MADERTETMPRTVEPTKGDREAFEQIRGRRSRPHKKAAPEPSPEPEPEDEPPEEPEELEPDEDAGEDEGDEELEKARKALERLKVPRAALDALDREEIIAWADERSGAEARTQAEYQALKEQLKGAAEADGPKTDAGASEEEPSGEPDFAVLAEPIAQRFSDLFLDAEDAKGLGKTLETAFEQLYRSATAPLDRVMSVLTTLVPEVEGVLQRQAKADLASRWPQIESPDDPTAWARVIKATGQLNAAAYSSREAMLEAACKLVFSDGDAAKGKKASGKSAGRRAAADAMSVPTGKAERKSARKPSHLNGSEADYAVFRSLRQHRGVKDRVRIARYAAADALD